jgi:uncharacterized membrane protein YdjX (TVP38/TMEM64 family)
MQKEEKNQKPSQEKKADWLKNRLVPILSLCFIIAIIVGVFYFYREYPDKVDALEEYGYLGAFLISILLNATVVLPAGNFLVLVALGATMPAPTLVGLAGGLGAAIGESTGYLAGLSGRALIQRQKLYTRLENWVKRWGMLTIFGLSMAPLFFDLAGIAAGVLRFPYWKFFIACWLGRTVLYILIAWAGALGWDALLDFLG